MRILFAEDSPYFQDMVPMLLEKRGHTLVMVKDGAAALERVRAEKFDMLLTDNQMPEKNGIDVLKILRADLKFKTLPVIVYSSDNGDVLSSSVRSLGGIFVEKGKMRDIFTALETIEKGLHE